MIRTILIPLAFAAGLAAAIGIATADTRRTPPVHGGPRRPPKEALAACQKKFEGDACTVQLPDRSIDGVCKNGPDGDGPLVCVPDHPPGPPPEAIDACHGKTSGDACSVDVDGHHFDGTCRTGPDGGGPLACAPAGGP